MTVERIDNLDLYSTAADLAEAVFYVTGGGVTIVDDGKYGGKAARIATNSDSLAVPYFQTGNLYHIFQAWVKFEGFSDTNDFFKIGSNSLDCCKLRTSASRRVKVVDANDAVVAESADNVLSAHVYHYIEIKIFNHNTTGSAAVKIDGVQVVSVSSVDTMMAVGWPSRVTLKSAGNTEPTVWDDLIAITSAGSAWEIRDWIGERYIHLVLPDADTSQEDWTCSSGSDSYALVDDPVPGDHDGDSSNISSNNEPDETRVTCASLPEDVSVDVVSITVSGKKTGSGEPECCEMVLKSGATTEDFSSPVGDGVYQASSRIWQRDPDGGGQAWTRDTVNALEVGVRVITCPS